MLKTSIESKIGKALLRRGWDLSLAESCTGGLVGHRITAVAGSSRYFRGGVVAYDDSVKRRLLAVRPATLRLQGAVSAETAREMARGVRRALGTRVGLSVTGIAGPGGGTPEKPVGLVYAAVSAGRRLAWREGRFRGGRAAVRRQAADMALNLLISLLDEDG